MLAELISTLFSVCRSAVRRLFCVVSGSSWISELLWFPVAIFHLIAFLWIWALETFVYLANLSIEYMVHVIMTQINDFNQANDEFLEKFPLFARRPEKSGLDEIREAIDDVLKKHWTPQSPATLSPTRLDPPTSDCGRPSSSRSG